MDTVVFDEILDWLQLNADSVNLQRLTRLQKDHALGDPSIIAAIANQLTCANAHPKWRPLAAAVPIPTSARLHTRFFPTCLHPPMPMNYGLAGAGSAP